MIHLPNVTRFSGFADIYDRVRPAPPEILAKILTQLAQVDFPHRVIDLGSGTGLSTRYWADKAEQVIGIEPSENMRSQAEASTSSANITYRSGCSHATGLPDGYAQIVTCSQSLHWMDPQPTFQEVHRILVPGGVFAAFDFDWPPTTPRWEADAAYLECSRIASDIEATLPGTGVLKQDKSQHLARMKASHCFRFTKEIMLHHIDSGNAERLVGLALSQGGIQTLLKSGYSEADLGIERLRLIAENSLGSQSMPWVWSLRVRIGIP
jgi:ubiquinone/menaquinone biosynthesis C-methylase UbiE